MMTSFEFAQLAKPDWCALSEEMDLIHWAHLEWNVLRDSVVRWRDCALGYAESLSALPDEDIYETLFLSFFDAASYLAYCTLEPTRRTELIARARVRINQAIESLT